MAAQGSNALITAVITTIQAPTPAVRELAARLAAMNSGLVIVGDKKGPKDYDLPNTHFLSLADQLSTKFKLARSLPVGHYARKNVGYLEAILRGAECLYETDDDNAPMPSWTVREEFVDAAIVLDQGWVNVYRCFSDQMIWPRGLPLDCLAASPAPEIRMDHSPRRVRAPIQQGLANGSPDVDAIWRLVMDRPFDFDQGPSVLLGVGSWCPFNSQSTWWWKEAFPLLYLPSYCSFRMTDIWRSFIAQRCLWELGLGLVFHGPEVLQDRNEHNLMRDFNDEIPGYQRNRELAQVLDGTALDSGSGAVTTNLRRCYEALVAHDFFVKAELDLVSDWCDGLEEASRGG